MSQKIMPSIWFHTPDGTVSEIITYYKNIFGSEFAGGSITPLGKTPSGNAEMAQVTQQNAALVEESAAAASSLSQQAESLSRAVSAFQVQQERAAPAYVAPARAELPARPARRTAAPLPASETTWEAF